MEPERKCRKLPFRSSFYDIFSALVDPKDQKRIKACDDLISCLIKAGVKAGKNISDQDATISSMVEYSLKRLVQGLASSRQMARPGFAMALTQLLRNCEDVTVGQVLESLKEHLKFVKQESKYAQAQIILGRIMVFMALIRAQRLSEASNEQVEFIVKGILQIRKERSYLKQMCAMALVELSREVSTAVFKESVFPHLREELTMGWEKCDPDTLYLLISLTSTQKKTIGKKFLTEFWKRPEIIDVANMRILADVVMQAAGEQPTIPPLCVELLRCTIDNEELFRKFWKVVIDDTLLTNLAPKKILAYRMVDKALEFSSSASQVQTILSKKAVESISQHAADQVSKLRGPAVKVINSITSKCRNSRLCACVIDAILSVPLSAPFDIITKTRTVFSMVTELKKDDATAFAKKCLKFLKGESIFSMKPDTRSNQQWAFMMLSNLSSTSDIDLNTRISIMQFLFTRAFFSVEKPSSSIPHCQSTKTNIISDIAQTYFLKSLDNLMTHQPTIKDGGEPEKMSFLKVIVGVMEHAEVLLENAASVKPRKGWTDEIKEEWRKVLGVVEKIKEKKVHTPDESAFQLLFMYSGIQLFHQPDNIMDILKDLHVCYSKAMKKKRKSIGPKADEPEWLDVMMELFLCLLSRPSHLTRTVVSTTYKFLSPHMNRGTISQILDVLSGGNDEEDDQIKFEDEDDATDEGIGNDSPDSESDSNSDSESEAENDQEENIGVDPALRAAVKAALGGAAATESDDDEEEEKESDDMNDEAMFRIDDALADAFKSMLKRKSSKAEEEEKQKQLNNFRLRCLDLLIQQIKHGHESTTYGMLLDMVMPLLLLMDSSIKQKNNKHVYNKAKELLLLIVKQRKVHSDIDNEEIVEVLKSCIEFSKKVSLPPIQDCISECCAFIVRIAVGRHEITGPSPVKTRAKRAQGLEKMAKNDLPVAFIEIIGDALKNFLYKRDSHLNSMLFICLCERQPAFMWPLNEILISAVKNPDVRIYCKTQACIVLAALVCKEVADNASNDWQSFGENIFEMCEKVLSQLSDGPLKPKLIQKLLTVVHRLLLVSKHSGNSMVIPAKLIVCIKQLKKHGNKDLSKLCKKICNWEEQVDGKTGARKRKHTDAVEQDSELGKRSKAKDEIEREMPDTATTTPTSKRKRKSSGVKGEEMIDGTGSLEMKEAEDKMKPETPVPSSKTPVSKSKRKWKSSGEEDKEVTIETNKLGRSTPKIQIRSGSTVMQKTSTPMISHELSQEGLEFTPVMTDECRVIQNEAQVAEGGKTPGSTKKTKRKHQGDETVMNQTPVVANISKVDTPKSTRKIKTTKKLKS